MQVSRIELGDFEKMFDLKKDDFSKKILECNSNSSADLKVELQQKNPNIKFCHANDLEKLPYKTDEFDLALCAFQVFNHHDPKKINALISEMIRVAFEVRIYPLCDDKGTLNPLLGIVMAQLQAMNLRVEIRAVAYEAFKGSNAMLRVWREECEL